MIAGHRDLPQVILDRFRITGILFRNRVQPDDGVQGRADIMGHRREEIGFCFVCRRCFFRCCLELFIEINHNCHVKQEQNQETCGNKTYQQPVFSIYIQVLHRHKAEERPSSRRRNRGVGENTFFPAGIEHGI